MTQEKIDQYGDQYLTEVLHGIMAGRWGAQLAHMQRYEDMNYCPYVEAAAWQSNGVPQDVAEKILGREGTGAAHYYGLVMVYVKFVPVFKDWYLKLKLGNYESVNYRMLLFDRTIMESEKSELPKWELVCMEDSDELSKGEWSLIEWPLTLRYNSTIIEYFEDNVQGVVGLISNRYQPSQCRPIINPTAENIPENDVLHPRTFPFRGLKSYCRAMDLARALRSCRAQEFEANQHREYAESARQDFLRLSGEVS